MSEKSLQQRLFIWFWCSLICIVIQGTQVGGFFGDMIQSGGYNMQAQGGLLQLIILAPSFFGLLIAKLLLFDYSFLTGIFVVIRFGMIIYFGIPMVYGLYTALAWLIR